MPRYADNPNAGKLARLLLDYMWSQRPPLTYGQLAVKLGENRSSVYNWVYRNQIPTPQLLALISSRTGIPLYNLYQAADYPIPEPPAQAQPAPQTQPQPPIITGAISEQVWEALIDRTIASMRALQAQGRFSDDDIHAVVAEIRHQQLGVPLEPQHTQEEKEEQAPTNHDTDPNAFRSPTPSGPKRPKGPKRGDGPASSQRSAPTSRRRRPSAHYQQTTSTPPTNRR
jgi:transcriptional regulator with XRE-family HTH domain